MVFGNVCLNKVVRINNDNVASRGAVGRTHTIVRLQTRICRKDGTENFGGFVFVFDLRNGVMCCGFCVLVQLQSLFSGYHAENVYAPPIHPGLSRLYHHCTAITPVYIYWLSRHSLVPHQGYHTRAITLHHTRKSGYHTLHSSSFVVYHSPAITPRVFLHLHRHRGAQRTDPLNNGDAGSVNERVRYKLSGLGLTMTMAGRPRVSDYHELYTVRDASTVPSALPGR